MSRAHSQSTSHLHVAPHSTHRPLSELLDHDAPAGETVLVIEDEPHIRRAVANALRDGGRRVEEAATAREGIDRAASARPDLIVLDLGLPDLPGLDVCRELRAWTTAPIVVLSARDTNEEKVLLLDAGADDYVTKPFNMPELLARVQAQLRRARLGDGATAQGELRLGDVVLDLARRTATRGGAPLRLTPTEWKLLRVLAAHVGRTLTHAQLFSAVWGRAFGNPQQYLRVHVTNLRRKVERDPALPQLIITEPGVGYRCELPRTDS